MHMQRAHIENITEPSPRFAEARHATRDAQDATM